MTTSSVLDQISGTVRRRLLERKAMVPPAELARQVELARTPLGFKEAFKGPGINVLAEVKFSSPSQGQLTQTTASPAWAAKIATSYIGHGAVALSILTEQDHFHGHLDYLRAVRAGLPSARLLLKDFVVDEYQLMEARVAGADAALLIMALLGEPKASELMARCRQLGLTALVEVHDEQELASAVRIGAELIGVNNRDLKTLAISLETSNQLAKLPRGDALLISESGLTQGAQLKALKAQGFSGFLVGTTFMKTEDPGGALARMLWEAR